MAKQTEMLQSQDSGSPGGVFALINKIAQSIGRGAASFLGQAPSSTERFMVQESNFSIGQVTASGVQTLLLWDNDPKAGARIAVKQADAAIEQARIRVQEAEMRAKQAAREAHNG